MSRSRKKTPILKGNGKSGVSYAKRVASKKVRQTRMEWYGKGNYYRKVYQQYFIHDYVSYRSEQSARKRGEMDMWEKYHHRK